MCDVIVIVKTTHVYILFLKKKYFKVSLPCSERCVCLLSIHIVYLYLHHIKIVTTIFYLIYETVNTLILQQMALKKIPAHK